MFTSVDDLINDASHKARTSSISIGSALLERGSMTLGFTFHHLNLFCWFVRPCYLSFRTLASAVEVAGDARSSELVPTHLSLVVTLGVWLYYHSSFALHFMSPHPHLDGVSWSQVPFIRPQRLVRLRTFHSNLHITI